MPIPLYQTAQLNTQLNTQLNNQPTIQPTIHPNADTQPNLYPITSALGPFLKIQNGIIENSASFNHTMLPTYFYLATHQNQYNKGLIDTNLSLISEFIYPNSDIRLGLIGSIKEGLELLMNGSDTTYDDKGNEYKKIEKAIKLYNLAGKTVSNTKPVSSPVSNPISKTSYLQCKLLDSGSSELTNDFTIIYYSEFYYILNSIRKYNTSADVKPINFCDFFNLYCYLKMKIGITSAYRNKVTPKAASSSKIINDSKTTTTTTTTHRYFESLKNISYANNLGTRTVSRYLTLMETMGLIYISTKESLNGNISNCYDSSLKWSKNFA